MFVMEKHINTNLSNRKKDLRWSQSCREKAALGSPFWAHWWKVYDSWIKLKEMIGKYLLGACLLKWILPLLSAAQWDKQCVRKGTTLNFPSALPCKVTGRIHLVPDLTPRWCQALCHRCHANLVRGFEGCKNLFLWRLLLLNVWS